ncbi:hypothetical protein [Nocardia abscessus]|uniref:hypothetical protein n=1 Tax=Nocardia abscessus TaxID=120957 RepID=UPI0024556B6E|nr:hypothetical protein [Nocardia abscessus]
MSWDWTLATALIGAVTGSYGAVVSTMGRRDVKWRRRAKQLPVVRPALEQLRAALAEVERGNRQIHRLNDLTLRGHLDVLEEKQPQLADRALSKLVSQSINCYSRVVAAGDDSPDHVKSAAIERALTVLKSTICRADYIENKAPS